MANSVSELPVLHYKYVGFIEEGPSKYKNTVEIL